MGHVRATEAQYIANAAIDLYNDTFGQPGTDEPGVLRATAFVRAMTHVTQDDAGRVVQLLDDGAKMNRWHEIQRIFSKTLYDVLSSDEQAALEAEFGVEITEDNVTLAVVDYEFEAIDVTDMKVFSAMWTQPITEDVTYASAGITTGGVTFNHMADIVDWSEDSPTEVFTKITIAGGLMVTVAVAPPVAGQAALVIVGGSMVGVGSYGLYHSNAKYEQHMADGNFLEAYLANREMGAHTGTIGAGFLTAAPGGIGLGLRGVRFVRGRTPTRATPTRPAPAVRHAEPVPAPAAIAQAVTTLARLPKGANTFQLGFRARFHSGNAPGPLTLAIDAGGNLLIHQITGLVARFVRVDAAQAAELLAGFNLGKSFLRASSGGIGRAEVLAALQRAAGTTPQTAPVAPAAPAASSSGSVGSASSVSGL